MADDLPFAPIRKGYLELALRRLSGFSAIDANEQEAIRRLPAPRCQISKGQELAAHATPRLYFVLEGWGSRSRDFNETRRQIFDLILPGDIVGSLPGEAEQPRYKSIALTQMMVVEATSLGAVDEDGRPINPGILQAIAGFRRRAQERLLDHVVRLGSRKAYESVGHFLIELYTRQAELGLAHGMRLPFLVGQERLGEILGISEAHVNRTLTRLRIDGHLTTGPGWIALPKLEELAERVDYPLPQAPTSTTRYSMWSGA